MRGLIFRYQQALGGPKAYLGGTKKKQTKIQMKQFGKVWVLKSDTPEISSSIWSPLQQFLLDSIPDLASPPIQYPEPSYPHTWFPSPRTWWWYLAWAREPPTEALHTVRETFQLNIREVNLGCNPLATERQTGEVKNSDYLCDRPTKASVILSATDPLPNRHLETYQPYIFLTSSMQTKAQ